MDILAPILPDTNFPEYVDFKTLRREGLEHIAAFSEKLWTDHNIHDPGITILEALCYVLTDLDYRTKLDFKDLVTKEDGSASTNFLTPAQILGNNPLTVMDYRKMLIDIIGVRNAWLEPINPIITDGACADKKEADPGYFLSYDCQSRQLQNAGEASGNLKLPLHGLYKVLIEPDDIYPSAFEKNACGNSEFNQDFVIEETGRRLQAHRNLCEDFADIVLLVKEPVSFCLHVELKPDADPDDVLTNIFSVVQDFFSPAPQFYTLKQMLDKRKTMDEIFEGRPMDFQSPEPKPVQTNGFIDTEELQNLPRHRIIYTSDLYRIIMGVDGVDGITRLVLFSEVQPPVNDKGGEEWTLTLLADHRPVLAPENCNVIFFKNKLPFSIDSKKARGRYLKGLSDFNKSKKNDDELDPLIPVGRKLDLAQYKSVQYEFPRAYYIGKNDVPGDAAPLRKVQSLQLQGYLLFYDRLLADYFAQLSNILPLFSLQKNAGAPHTYFTAGLDDIPMLPSLLRGFQKEVDYGTSQTPYNGMRFAFEPIPGEDVNLRYRQRTYESSYSRDEAIQRMMNACNNASLEPEVKKNERGRFYFVLYDTNGTTFLQSYLHFDTEADALRAARDVIFMGGLPSCYQRNNELQKGEFSFDLVFHKTDYKEYIGSLNEPEPVFFERKEKFLNHLLARFAEDFTDYVLMMYALNGKKNDPERTIEDKQNFLSAYPDLSSNRGKAFDYTIQENKFPVSGLQKRVASLMGIHPYPGVSLNNFDIIPLNGQWFFRFFLPGDQDDAMPLFESVPVFSSEEEARSACARFLELAGNIDNYKNYGCTDEKVYGFSVQSHSKDKVWINARCTLSFTSWRDRNEIKEWLSKYIKANGKYTSGILLHQGSYFLFTDDKYKLLLKSAEGYSTEEKALEALYRCYQLIHIDEAWQVINADNTGRKIIVVSDPSFEPRIPLARHPRSFTSPVEADATMKTLKEFFRQNDLVYTEDTQPAWQWRLVIDTMGAWRTTRFFKKLSQLPGSFIQFLELASNDKNYESQKQADNSWQLRLTREEEIEAESTNRQTILGECLEKFSTEELAKQALALYVENNNYLWLWFNKSVREEKAFTYEFYDANVGNTEILLRTTVLIPGGASGGDMLSVMIRLAASSTTLVITTTSSGDDECLYQLQLQNEFQQVLAVTKEMSKKEAEELQARIMSLSARGFVFWKKADERNGYSVLLQNEEGADLLQGFFVFDSREEAMEALACWLMNYSPENFYQDHIAGKGYGYTVQLSGEPALGELFNFSTPDERDSRLYELRIIIETLSGKFNLKPGESRQYFFSIKDKEGKILLREVQPKQSLFEIQKAFYEACHLGKKEGQYNKKDGCMYGFSLPDERKDPLAIHPIEYLTGKERDAAMKHLIRFLEEHAPVTLIETLPGSWRYKWEWLSCNYTIETALESLEERTNEKEAADDMKLILQCAKEISFYKIVEKEKKEKDQKTEYNIYLRDGAEEKANWLALHPQDYTCKTKAGTIIQRLVEYARFELDQGARFDKKFGADERLQPNNDKKEGFRLWDRQFRMAIYYRGFTNAARRDKAARETWLHYRKYSPVYTTLDQSNAIITEDETSHLFFFNLVTNDGVVLWTSAEGYEEQEEAKSAFKKQYLQILELSRDKSNYNNWEPGVNSLLLYGKKCGSEEKILTAVFKPVFAKPEDFAQAIRMRQEAAHLFPVFKDGKSYAFRLYRADLKAYEWKGANRYTTVSEAWKAFTIFLELLGYAANYYPENRPEAGLYTISLRKVLFDICFDLEKQTKLYPDWKSGNAAHEDVSVSDPLQQFLSFISQDETMFYPFTDYSDRCRYGLRLVNQNRYRVARHTLWYESRREREEQRRKLQAGINCSIPAPVWLDCPGDCFEFPGLIDKEKIWRRPELVPKQEQWVYESFGDELGNTLYRYQLVEVPDMMNGKNKCRVLWRSVNHYRNDEPDFCMGKTSENFFYVEIMELARSVSSYVYEPIIGKGQHYRLYLKDIDGQVVAEAPEIICGDPVQDRNVRMINAMLYPIFKKENGYSFEINKVCQDTNGNEVTGYSFSTIWEGLQIFDSPDKAYDAYHHALNLLTDLRNYERADHSACGPFGIELVDPEQVMAVHPITYPDNEQRSDAIREIEKAISSEGFHVLEHILLRPVQSCQTSNYLFIDLVLYPARSRKEDVLFRIRSQSFFESPGSFIQALQGALKENKIHIQKQEDRFIVSFWNALQELLADAEIFGDDNFPKKKTSSKKKTTDDIIDSEKVCDDITKLLIDRLPKLGEGDVHTGDDSDPCCSESKLLSLCSEEDPCGSLKEGVGNDASCDLGFLADPYSFWATVVVPSWPRRFLLPRFREFLEKKLRDEAPAHVKLRIVWVSPADMRRFEKALGKWLQALTRKEGCDYQSQLSKLAEVLTEIRNEYPTAQLFGEGQGGFSAVLDEIVLK